MSEMQDTITGKDTLAAELRNQVDDLQYELNKVRARNDKLEHHLGEAIEKLKAFQQIHGTDEKGSNKPNTLVASSVSQTKVNFITFIIKCVLYKEIYIYIFLFPMFYLIYSSTTCKESLKRHVN